MPHESRDPVFTHPLMKRLCGLVINCIMYATSAGVESELRQPPRRKTQRARDDQTTMVSREEVFYLPGRVEISAQRKFQELARAPGGRKIMKRFMVRGHWRRANLNWKDQRPRWIRPHWKGPDIATIIEHQYRLKP